MLADKDAGFFWRHLGATTLGKHIQLGKFHTLVDTAVRAICLRETGEKEIRLKVSSIVHTHLCCTSTVDLMKLCGAMNRD